MISRPRPTIARWVLLATAALLTTPAPAAAQEVGARAVTVALWPEYDRAEVLVIYRVLLPETSVLPTRLRLPIPPDAPELTAVAYRDSGGTLLNAPYVRDDGEGADFVEVETPGSEVQLEFYLPLPVDGDRREFAFTWPGGFSADSLEFEIQQPAAAQGMEITPAPTSQTSDASGLTFHHLAAGALADSTRPEVGFTYRNPTARLSADAGAPAGPLATPAPASQPTLELPAVLPWLLLVVGIALIGGGVIYYLRSRADERPPKARHRPTPRTEEAANQVDASPVFCHNCGTQASASDRFCRRCGTALRT
jgi:hypothetical protein